MKSLRIFTLIILAALLPLSHIYAAVSTDSKTASDYNSDNTGKNKRDSRIDELTAQDQSNRKSDVAITRKIRQDLIKDKSLSVSAHNVKIIVAQNTVTLKGPVKTARERNVIEAKARAIAPELNVVDELQVIKK